MEWVILKKPGPGCRLSPRCKQPDDIQENRVPLAIRTFLKMNPRTEVVRIQRNKYISSDDDVHTVSCLLA